MASKYTIKYLEPAQNDLVEIFDYIALDSPQSASKFIDKIDLSIRLLGSHPLLGATPKDQRLKKLGYRMLIINSYLAFYKVKSKTVFIYRIIHGKRRYRFLL